MKAVATPAPTTLCTLARGMLNAAVLSVLLVSAVHASPPDHACPTARHAPFSAMYVFGDSLSDTGNCFDAIGWPPADYFFEGRQCDGPVWVDYLADTFGLSENRVHNFAFNGAGTGQYNAWELEYETDLPGMLDQYALFVRDLGRCGRTDPNALYVVFGGANDAFRILLYGEDWESSINATVRNLVRIIAGLRARGARHIMVVDVPDLGLTPRMLDNGASPYATAISLALNAELDRQLGATGIPLMRVSVFALLHECVDHPVEHGLINVRDEGLYAGTGDGYLFWDPVHPTTLTHMILADVMADEVGEALHVRPRGRWWGWIHGLRAYR